jgi:hypothetical protein
MKTFDDYEKRERKFLNWYLNDRCYKCKLEEESPIGSYERNDFVILSGRTYIMGEIKIREFESDKYPTAIIELDKINALMEKFQPYYQMGKTNKLYYYAAYPKSRKILVFDIMNTPSTITYEFCPITTASDKGNKMKAMINYAIDNAITEINY